jgi:NAD-dependent SIR2 family protein deacetylase
METAREMTLQQSVEVATRNWASIHNRGRCPRCSGLMVDEWYQDLSDYRAQRCVQCGEMIDPVILRNRGALYGPMTTQLAGKMLPNNCVTKGQQRGDVGNSHGVSRWGG